MWVQQSTGTLKPYSATLHQTSTRQTGWREGLRREQWSSPDLQQLEAEDAGAAGLVFITEKAAECWQTGAYEKVLQRPYGPRSQLDGSSLRGSGERGKQYFFKNHKARFKGRRDLWCCIRRRDDSRKIPRSSMARKPALVVVSRAKHWHNSQQFTNLKRTYGPAKITPLAARVREASLFYRVLRKTDSKASRAS